MDRYEAVLKVTVKGAQSKEKGGKKGPAQGAPAKRIFEFAYTKKNGTPGRRTVTTLDLSEFEDGTPCFFEMEGNVITKCEIGGQTIVPAPRAARDMVAPPPAKNQGDGGSNRGSAYGGGRYAGAGYGSAGGGAGGASAKSIRWGHGPYNFAPYMPNLIAPPFDDEERCWSGQIICDLTAKTPLLVAGRHEKNPDGSTNCSFMEIGGKYVIPGTSVKGMLRSLMEALSWSGLRPVSDKKLFWRDVQDGDNYRALFAERPIGGFLRQHGADFTLVEVEVTKDARDSGYKKVKTGKKVGADRTPNTYYFKYPAPNATGEAVPSALVSQFRAQLTEDQETRWPEKRRSELLRSSPGLPVFFRRNEKGEIAELGFCRYFRLQYKYSPYDLAWPDREKRDIRDVAQAIFGYVGRSGSRRGRVSVRPFEIRGKICESEFVCVVLGGPKPTCLPFYLRQNPKDIRTTLNGQKNKRDSMANYNSLDSKLRGRKFYWHSARPVNNSEARSAKIASHLFPLDRGARGTFVIQINRLTDSELGCLFEALELVPGCAHKLGMGKPLGLGSVEIRVREARLEKVGDKYASLAARLQKTAPLLMAPEERAALREKFRGRILAFLKSRGISARDYYELEPIRELLQILAWRDQPDAIELAYPTLKEYMENPVLPQPDTVKTYPVDHE